MLDSSIVEQTRKRRFSEKPRPISDIFFHAKDVDRPHIPAPLTNTVLYCFFARTLRIMGSTRHELLIFNQITVRALIVFDENEGKQCTIRDTGREISTIESGKTHALNVLFAALESVLHAPPLIPNKIVLVA